MSIDNSNWYNVVGRGWIADYLWFTCMSCDQDVMINREVSENQNYAARCGHCRLIHILICGNTPMGNAIAFTKKQMERYGEDVSVVARTKPRAWCFLVERHAGLHPFVPDEAVVRIVRDMGPDNEGYRRILDFVRQISTVEQSPEAA